MKDINYYREMYLKGSPKVGGREVKSAKKREEKSSVPTNADRGPWALLMLCALLITACCIFSVSHFAAAVFMIVALAVMIVIKVKSSWKEGDDGNDDF